MGQPCMLPSPACAPLHAAMPGMLCWHPLALHALAVVTCLHKLASAGVVSSAACPQCTPAAADIVCSAPPPFLAPQTCCSAVASIAVAAVTLFLPVAPPDWLTAPLQITLMENDDFPDPTAGLPDGVFEYTGSTANVPPFMPQAPEDGDTLPGPPKVNDISTGDADEVPMQVRRRRRVHQHVLGVRRLEPRAVQAAGVDCGRWRGCGQPPHAVCMVWSSSIAHCRGVAALRGCLARPHVCCGWRPLPPATLDALKTLDALIDHTLCCHRATHLPDWAPAVLPALLWPSDQAGVAPDQQGGGGGGAHGVPAGRTHPVCHQGPSQLPQHGAGGWAAPRPGAGPLLTGCRRPP